jgi:hypothetical protein
MNKEQNAALEAERVAFEKFCAGFHRALLNGGRV